MTLVRATSNRARAKLRAVLDVQQLDSYFVFGGHNDYVSVPDEHLTDVLAITGVSRARPTGKVMKCWTL